MDIKEAVKSATQYIQMAYEGQHLDSLLLEEVEKVDDQWHVTLSFTRPVDSPGSLQGVFAPQYIRVYKVVEINATTGEFIGLKIRET